MTPAQSRQSSPVRALNAGKWPIDVHKSMSYREMSWCIFEELTKPSGSPLVGSSHQHFYSNSNAACWQYLVRECPLRKRPKAWETGTEIDSLFFHSHRNADQRYLLHRWSIDLLPSCRFHPSRSSSTHRSCSGMFSDVVWPANSRRTAANSRRYTINTADTLHPCYLIVILFVRVQVSIR